MAKDQKDFGVEISPYNPLPFGHTTTVVYNEVRAIPESSGISGLINDFITFFTLISHYAGLIYRLQKI
jgi:hypothetical protein